MVDIYQALAQASACREPATVGIITRIKGSSPQKSGAKAIFYPDGRIVGTLGGGCLEAEIQRRAIDALKTGKAESFDLLLDHDFGWDDGLICGGKVFGLILPQALEQGADLWPRLAKRNEPIEWGVTNDFAVVSQPKTKDLFYSEVVVPPCPLWIAGAGHIAKALAPLAVSLDFAVTVFDDRPALANETHFPSEVQLQVGYWDALLSVQPPKDRTLFGVIVTRGHKHDALVLRKWIRYPFAFLGMIGSKRKLGIIRNHFLTEGLATQEQFDRLHCPVGLDIVAQSPQEIAVSIAAQLIKMRNGSLLIKDQPNEQIS